MALDFVSSLNDTWSSTLNWSGGMPPRIPLASDDVTNVDGLDCSVDITTAVCRSLDFSTMNGGIFSIQSGKILSIGDGSGGSFNIGGGSFNNVSGELRFVATTTGCTITTGGANLKIVTFNGSSGGWTFADTITASLLTLTNGTLNFGNQNVTITTGLVSSGSGTRTLTLGSGTITLSAASGTVWGCTTSTNLTVSATTGTIAITSTGASDKTFAGGGKTYNVLQFTAGGAGAIIVTGANTFTQITRSGTGTKTVKFPASVTNTLTHATAPLPSGTAGNLITLRSSSGGSQATLNLGGNTVTASYLDVADIAVTNGTLDLSDGTSTDSGNNTGISWTAGGASAILQDQQTMRPLPATS